MRNLRGKGQSDTRDIRIKKELRLHSHRAPPLLIRIEMKAHYLLGILTTSSTGRAHIYLNQKAENSWC